jgi:hypothetical protein
MSFSIEISRWDNRERAAKKKTDEFTSLHVDPPTRRRYPIGTSERRTTDIVSNG